MLRAQYQEVSVLVFQDGIIVTSAVAEAMKNNTFDASKDPRMGEQKWLAGIPVYIAPRGTLPVLVRVRDIRARKRLNRKGHSTPLPGGGLPINAIVQTQA